MAEKRCPICKGTGIVFYSLGRGGAKGVRLCEHIEKDCLCHGEPPYEVYSSRLNAMLPCVCKEPRLRIQNIKNIYSRSAIPPRYQWKYLEDFKEDWTGKEEGETQLVSMMDFADHFIEDFKVWENNKRWFFFWGPTGSGKTFISCIILNELIRRYFTNVRYAKISRDFIRKIQSSFSKQDESYGQGGSILKSLQMVEVLVLDDFGTQKDSNWTDSILYDLIDHRYENNMFTLFTSNNSPESLRTLAEGRIYSRMMEMTQFIKIDQVPDYRSFNLGT